MALFKIEKGLASSLATARPNTNEGWCYFTTDDGKFYIDIDTKTGDTSGRIVLNAGSADKLTCGNIGNENTPVYFENGIPVACTSITAGGVDGEFLPLSAGEENKLTGALGLPRNIMYGNTLPETGFEGQLFFLEDCDLPLPPGGSRGQALIKNSSTDGDASWQEIVALPKGGEAGQALIKTSSTDGDAEWKEIVALPKGGAAGQVLTKNSSTDGDATWATSIAGNAATATALTSNAGSSTAPIYFSNGKPVACGNSLAVSITGSSASCTGNAATATSATNAQNIYSSASTSKAYILGTTTASSANHATVYNASVYTSGSVLYGAAWNDYAEYRTQKESIEPGYCVASADDGRVYKTTEKFQACDGIVSDTFGFAIGETDECKTPLAVAGRVLAYCSGNRNDYHSGDTVCAGPKGKVCKMTREEIREWPDRIIGIVSEIPEYEIWGTGNVPVNGRIWIKIK